MKMTQQNRFGDPETVQGSAMRHPSGLGLVERLNVQLFMELSGAFSPESGEEHNTLRNQMPVGREVDAVFRRPQRNLVAAEPRPRPAGILAHNGDFRSSELYDGSVIF